MPITAAQVEEAAARWGLSTTAAPVADRLAAYGNLLLHWNTRLSLTAIRDEAELIERHLMEGVFAAAHHPEASDRPRLWLRHWRSRHPDSSLPPGDSRNAR